MYHPKDFCQQQTLGRLQQGDREAFDVVFYTFEPRIFSFALKLTHHQEDARELVQEVFLKVWEKRESIDAQANFEGFLFTMAKNLIYNRARHRVYEMKYREEIRMGSNLAESVTEQMLEASELEDIIEAACKKLPPVRREVFMMSRHQGLSHSEIANKMDTSTSNIKNHIFKALVFLKEQIRHQNVLRAVLLLFSLLK